MTQTLLFPLWIRLRYGWGLLRWLRLFMGVAFAGSGMQGQETAVTVFGALLALQALLNLGCDQCASGTCAPHAAKMQRSPTSAEDTAL
ncbi:MAG: hypothetical protein D6722_07150 [Bacteroidetes bacterium]|nr:MAG: hypothetical protein D6722_07150 [Bacteroidota bacterium]